MNLVTALIVCAAACCAVLLRRLDRLQQHIKQQQRRPPAAATRRVAASQPLAPITSFTDAIAELRAHYEEYRYIEAGALLDRLRMSLKAAGASTAAAEAGQQLQALLASGQLEARAAECHEALAALRDDEGWSAISSGESYEMARRDRPGVLEVRARCPCHRIAWPHRMTPITCRCRRCASSRCCTACAPPTRSSCGAKQRSTR